MYQIRVHKNIQRVSAGFYFFGLWQNEDETYLRKVTKKLFHFIYAMSIVMALLTGAYVNDNNNESIFLTAITVIFLVAFVKLTFVITKKKQIVALLSEIGVYSFEDHKEFTDVKKKLTNFAFLSYFLLFATIVGVFFPPILALPVFSSEKTLPYNVGFPLNWKDSEIMYWVSFIYVQCGIFFFAVYAFSALQLWYLMIHFSIKYEIIGNQLKNLGLTKLRTVKNSNTSQTQNQNVFLRDLIKLVKSHRQTKETIKEFRDCFSYLFFVQITTSAVGVCSSVYVLAFSSNGNWFEIGLFAVALTYSIWDILMVMYFGNEIQLSHNQLSYCLFRSDWIDESESIKKRIIILTEFLRQPQELIIFKLYPLDLKTFTRILNLSYSMFNVLANLNNNSRA